MRAERDHSKHDSKFIQRAIAGGRSRGARAISVVRGRLVLGVCLAALLIGLVGQRAVSARQAGASLGDYPLFDYDPGRSGVVPVAGDLSTLSVARLRHQWTTVLDDDVDSAPIELRNVSVGSGRINLIFLTGRTGRVYALNADTGTRVWTVDTTRGEHLAGYRITTSSPAADPSRLWIYSASPDGLVHKLAAASGREAPGWPVRVTLIPQYEKISSALNVVGTTVLVTTSGYIGDFGHYDGHLVAIDTATRALSVFNTLCGNNRQVLTITAGAANYCPAVQSGVWARGGALVDRQAGSPTQGQVFIVTGNGPYDGRTFWGDSVLRLTLEGGSLSLADAYTPTNQQLLNQTDQDLGSTTPILVPRQPGAHPWVALQGGKDDRLRLFDRANMSGMHGAGHLGGELLSVPLPQGGQLPTTGISWTSNGATLVAIANTNGIAVLRLSWIGASPRLATVWMRRSAATSPLLAGGMLFAAGSGDIRAYQPDTGAVLWNSAGSAGGAIGTLHWQSPMVADNQVVIADESNRVTAFGL